MWCGNYGEAIVSNIFLNAYNMLWKISPVKIIITNNSSALETKLVERGLLLPPRDEEKLTLVLMVWLIQTRHIE